MKKRREWQHILMENENVDVVVQEIMSFYKTAGTLALKIETAEETTGL